MERGKHQVAGERCLDANGGGFLIAHFPDHDAVRILPQESAENPREVETDGVVDRDLDDAVDVILDRVLGGEELGIDGVDAPEGGVERGGLASAGGTGDDEDAVRLFDRVGDVIVDVVGEAEILKRQVDRRAVEHPEHDRLTMVGRQRGDAHVHLFFTDLFDDPAVLRDAALGDVHVRHDLDARNDGTRQMDRRRRHFVKRAVHPVADLEILFEGLEMNVGGLLLDGLVEHEIDVTDDRRGVRLGFEIRCVEILTTDFELAEDVFHRLTLATVALVDFGFDEVVGRDDHMDFPAEGKPQIFRRLGIERIDERHIETGLVEIHW